MISMKDYTLFVDDLSRVKDDQFAIRDGHRCYKPGSLTSVWFWYWIVIALEKIKKGFKIDKRTESTVPLMGKAPILGTPMIGMFSVEDEEPWWNEKHHKTLHSSPKQPV